MANIALNLEYRRLNTYIRQSVLRQYRIYTTTATAAEAATATTKHQPKLAASSSHCSTNNINSNRPLWWCFHWHDTNNVIGTERYHFRCTKKTNLPKIGDVRQCSSRFQFFHRKQQPNIKKIWLWFGRARRVLVGKIGECIARCPRDVGCQNQIRNSMFSIRLSSCLCQFVANSDVYF